MPRAKVTYSRYLRIRREAEEVAATIKTPGWKLIEEDLLRQMSKIEELLSENRLRTVTETITTGGMNKTFTTTKEDQVAENAGMYKMGKWLLQDIQTIIEAPDKLAAMEREHRVVIAPAETSTPLPDEKPIPFKIPLAFKKIRTRIAGVLRRRDG